MIGKRIRQARLCARLTLEQLADQLVAHGIEISRQGISNYENNKRIPKPSILIAISKILNVKPSYFTTDPDVEIEWEAYRCQATLTKTLKEEIEAIGSSVAEKYEDMSSTLYPNDKAQTIKKIKVKNELEAEEAANSLRKLWNIGNAKIDSLTQLVENRGGIVVGHSFGSNRFDGLSGWVNHKHPIIVINSSLPDDRIRFNIGHELGHLAMDCSQVDGKKEERLAHRFSGAFLFPSEMVKKELGSFRKSILFNELAVLKLKYGLSMQACLFRALDSGIIDQSSFLRMFKEFSSRGWRKKEPIDFNGNEQPSKLRQMVLRSLAEKLITHEMAEDILPDITRDIDELGRTESKTSFSPSEILKLSPEERGKILQKAASKMERVYDENSDLNSFKENDIYDYKSSKS